MFAFSKKTLVILLIVAGFIAYFSSFGNPFIWDDEQFIQKNTYVQTFDLQKIFTTNTVAGAGVQSNYYRPLTTVSFAIDNKLWGLNPLGFHLTNTFLHTGSGVLLFLLLATLGFPELLGFFVSLFFLIHPIQTEAVVYINSRGDSLYALFLFLSLFLFAKVLRKRTWKASLARLLSLFLFFVAILSKETALAGIPLYIAIVFLDCLQKKFPFKHLFKRYGQEIAVIFFITLGAAVYFWLRLTYLNFGNTLNFYNGQNEYTKHLSIRLFTFARVFLVYVGLLLFPFRLHMERTVDLVKNIFSPYVWATTAVLLGAVSVSVLEISKKKSAFLLFAFLLFTCFLVPVSGIVPINGILYEHWLYVPMAGFFLFVFTLGFVFLGKKITQNIRYIMISLCTLICFMYIFITIKQTTIWANPITFYEHTLQYANSVRLHNNLGMAYDDAGRIDDAIAQYKKALQESNKFPEIYNNLGNVYKAKQEYTLAEESYKKAIAIGPKFIPAYSNLAELLLRENKNFDAYMLMARVVTRDPFNNDINFNLVFGEVCLKIHNKKLAENIFKHVQELSNNDLQTSSAIQQLLRSN